MSDPLPARRNLAAPVEKVVGKQRQASVGQPGKRGPAGVTAAEADGPYLDHAVPDLRRQNPTPDVLAGDDRTHDVNNEVIAEAYRRGLRIRGRHKVVRNSLDFLFGEG